MIEQLFGNDARRKIIEFFLTHIHESFSFDELKNRFDGSLSGAALKREAQALVESQVIEAYWHLTPSKIDVSREKSERNAEKNKKEILFRVNHSFPLLPELHSLVLKSIIFWEKKLVKKIKNSGSINYLAFTGFFTDTNHAPTDILIVGRVSKKKLGRIMKRFQSDLRRPVRYTLLSKKEFDYRMDITDRFLYDILESKKIVVVDDILKQE